MTWQWIGPTVFSLTLLPAGTAMAADWVPGRLRSRLTPVRPRGWALLAIYAPAPLNAIPRLAGATPEVTLAGVLAGGVLAVGGCVLIAIAARRTTHAAR
ncbi:hypothetical protein ABZ883_38465 [Streptomyces sp. NPDC046977]|uniref:hypothetical protein n=1 Tax=Streptomyces sp. NPDC046977 TaxID=3154703 RepID=UPI003402BD95